jgi:hypothetical protein
LTLSTDHPTLSTFRQGDPRERTVGMEFENVGKSAFSAPFNWAG